MKINTQKKTIKKLLSVVLTTSIIATNFSSVVQINAQTNEALPSQAAQVTTSQDDSVQTSQRPIEPTGEFIISNEDAFILFMTKTQICENNFKVILICDIDMKGKVFNPIKEFHGVFDGCGHTINNLKVQDKLGKGKNSELAFINTLNEFAEIKNVTFDNYTVECKSDIKKAAGLIITNHGTISSVDIINSNIYSIDKKVKSAGFVLNNEKDGVIESCHIENMNAKDAKIKSGFAGTNYGKIYKCNTTLSVNSKDLAGGFVIENQGIIEESNFKGDVESKKCAGGFCGSNSGEIVSCKAEGFVKATASKGATICGGFVSENGGIIKDCNSNGKIEGQEFTGGFVGINNDKGEINSCKATCDVKSHTYVASIHCGGIVGLNVGKIEDCNFDGTVDGCVDSGKVVGISVGVTIEVIAIITIIYLLAKKIKINYDINMSLDSFPEVPALAKLQPNNNFQTINYLINKMPDNLDNLEMSLLYKALISSLVSISIMTISTVTPILIAGRKCAYVGAFCGLNMGEIIRCSTNNSLIKAKTLYNKYNICGGFVGSNIGTIKDCTSTGSDIHNKTYAGGRLGGFAGENSGKIENGTTTVSVANGKYIGGFCGNNSGEMVGSKAEGNAKTDAKTSTNKTKCGGFVGNNEKGKIESCESTGNATGHEYVGGFCGDNSGKILKANSSGNAKAKTVSNTSRCGGFVGENSNIIKGSTSTGSATGHEYVGGFTGVNKFKIRDCNAHGKATAKTKTHTSLAGGFVGENEKGTITDCTTTGGAYARSTSGQAKAGGFAAINKAGIMNSKSSGYVYLSAGTCNKYDGCGGFVGKNDKGGKIDECYAECTVETTKKNKGGGFVGEAKNNSEIYDSECKTKRVIKKKKKEDKEDANFCYKKDKKAVIKGCKAE